MVTSSKRQPLARRVDHQTFESPFHILGPNVETAIASLDDYKLGFPRNGIIEFEAGSGRIAGEPQP